MKHLQRPGAIFGSKIVDEYLESEPHVFALFMQRAATINRENPMQNNKRTSFNLSKTIGIIINGEPLGDLRPSQLLKIEKILVKSIKVSDCHQISYIQPILKMFSLRIHSASMMMQMFREPHRLRLAWTKI